MKSDTRESFLTKPVNLYYMLLVSTFGLSLLGLIMVFSASSIHSLETKGSTYAIVLRQILFLTLSIPMSDTPLGMLTAKLQWMHCCGLRFRP